MSYTAVFNSSNYIIHMNQNHDKKGRFTYGDGDGDGVSNDHANQKKKDSYALEKSDSPKTIMVSTRKNPKSPFSGTKKTKIEVSDDVYKDIMKDDSKRSIALGTIDLAVGIGGIAAGILTDNPVVLGIAAVELLNSTVNYVNAGTHFINKITDSVYKDKPVEEIDTVIQIGNNFYNTKTKEYMSGTELKELAESKSSEN